MTINTIRIGLEVVIVIGIIVLACCQMGKRDGAIVIPPILTEGWASQVTQQAYFVVKDKQVIAICSREESAKKYAEERDAATFTVGINNGSDVILELKRDSETLTLNIASW